jgi:hypothetical protein
LKEQVIYSNEFKVQSAIRWYFATIPGNTGFTK